MSCDHGYVNPDEDCKHCLTEREEAFVEGMQNLATSMVEMKRAFEGFTKRLSEFMDRIEHD